MVAKQPGHQAATDAPPQPFLSFLEKERRQLHYFWKYQQLTISKVKDFKGPLLPLARIKKIMKADEDVRMIAGEVLILFAKACEIFLLELTLRSWLHAEAEKRRTLQKKDVAATIARVKIFDFLIDIVNADDQRGSDPPVNDVPHPVGGLASYHPPSGQPSPGMLSLPPSINPEVCPLSPSSALPSFVQSRDVGISGSGGKRDELGKVAHFVGGLANYFPPSEQPAPGMVSGLQLPFGGIDPDLYQLPPSMVLTPVLPSFDEGFSGSGINMMEGGDPPGNEVVHFVDGLANYFPPSEQPAPGMVSGLRLPLAGIDPDVYQLPPSTVPTPFLPSFDEGFSGSGRNMMEGGDPPGNEVVNFVGGLANYFPPSGQPSPGMMSMLQIPLPDINLMTGSELGGETPTDNGMHQLGSLVNHHRPSGLQSPHPSINPDMRPLAPSAALPPVVQSHDEDLSGSGAIPNIDSSDIFFPPFQPLSPDEGLFGTVGILDIDSDDVIFPPYPPLSPIFKFHDDGDGGNTGGSS